MKEKLIEIIASIVRIAVMGAWTAAGLLVMCLGILDLLSRHGVF